MAMSRNGSSYNAAQFRPSPIVRASVPSTTDQSHTSQFVNESQSPIVTHSQIPQLGQFQTQRPPYTQVDTKPVNQSLNQQLSHPTMNVANAKNFQQMAAQVMHKQMKTNQPLLPSVSPSKIKE